MIERSFWAGTDDPLDWSQDRVTHRSHGLRHYWSSTLSPALCGRWRVPSKSRQEQPGADSVCPDCRRILQRRAAA